MDLPTSSAAGSAVNQWPSNREPGVRLLTVPLPALFVPGAIHLKSRNHTGCSRACRRKCKVPPEWLSQLSSSSTFSRTDTLRDFGEVSQTPLRFPDSSTAWDRLAANREVRCRRAGVLRDPAGFPRLAVESGIHNSGITVARRSRAL